MSSTERKLISSLLFCKEAEQREEYFSELKRSGLKPEWFLDDKVKIVVEKIQEHYKDYKKVPNIVSLREYFRYDDSEWNKFFSHTTDLTKEINENGENFPFLLRCVKGGIIEKKSEDSIRKGLEQLSGKNYDEYLEILKKNIQEVTDISYYKDDRCLLYRGNIEERKQRYLKKLEDGGNRIYSGIQEVDDKVGGWNKKDMLVICGRPGNRKTFLNLKILSNIIKQKRRFKILIISMEMISEVLSDRLDALLFDLPYTPLSRGNLSENLQEEYFRKLSELEKSEDSGEVYIEDSVYDLFDLASKIMKYNPDIVMVDGGYLLKEYTAKTLWERASNIARELKNLAKKLGVLLFVTWQCNRDSENKEGSLSGLAYSDSVGHESDGVYQISETKKNIEYRLESLKVREGEAFNFNVKFDINKCEFKVLKLNDEEEDNKEESKNEGNNFVQEELIGEDFSDEFSFLGDQ